MFPSHRMVICGKGNSADTQKFLLLLYTAMVHDGVLDAGKGPPLRSIGLHTPQSQAISTLTQSEYSVVRGSQAGGAGIGGLLLNRFFCSSSSSVAHSATFLSYRHGQICIQEVQEGETLTHSATHSGFQLHCSTSPYMGWLWRG